MGCVPILRFAIRYFRIVNADSFTRNFKVNPSWIRHFYVRESHDTKRAEPIVYCFRKMHLLGSKSHAVYSITLSFYLGWRAYLGTMSKIRIWPYYNGYMTGGDGVLVGAWESFKGSYIILTPCLWCNGLIMGILRVRRLLRWDLGVFPVIIY